MVRAVPRHRVVPINRSLPAAAFNFCPTTTQSFVGLDPRSVRIGSTARRCLGGRQNAKMPAYRFVLQTFGCFIEVFEFARIAPAHRNAHGQLDGSFSGAVVECVAVP